MRFTLKRARLAVVAAQMMAVAALGLIACQDITNPSAAHPSPPAPRGEISDAAHGGGTPHFYFLSPMVAQPKYSGVFDGSLSPIVEICVLSGSSCGAAVAAYSISSGTGGETVRLNVSDQSYGVNWSTRSIAFDPSLTYRIRVKILQTELGHADVQLVNNGSAAKNVKTGDVITLIDGSTLPIRVRIEKGAVAPIGSSGGVATLDDGAVSLTFPAGATANDIAVTATPVPTGTPGYDASVISGTEYEFQPSPTTFAQPVTLSLAYPSLLPPRVKASRLAVCKMMEGACHPLQGGVANSTTHTVTAKIGSFSDYSVTPFPEMIYAASDGICATITACAFYLHTSTREVLITESEIRNAGGYYDGQLDLSWSPDGLQLVYVSENDSWDGQGHLLGTSFEIHVVNSDGSGDHILVGPISDDLGFVRWSPDGSRILFECGSGTVCTINPDGTGSVRVPNFLLAGAGRFEGGGLVSWAPDGSRILMAGSRPDGDSAGFWLASPTGGDVRLLAMSGDTTVEYSGYENTMNFGYSADGTQIAFLSSVLHNGNAPDLFVMNADGSNRHRVMNHTAFAKWSPVPGDNRFVFFGNGCYQFSDCGDPTDPSGGIWLINSDGSGLRQLLSDAGSYDSYDDGFGNLRWSPDGRRISFGWRYGPSGNGAGTYIMNSDGSGLQLIIPNAPTSEWRP